MDTTTLPGLQEAPLNGQTTANIEAMCNAAKKDAEAIKKVLNESFTFAKLIATRNNDAPEAPPPLQIIPFTHASQNIMGIGFKLEDLAPKSQIQGHISVGMNYTYHRVAVHLKIDKKEFTHLYTDSTFQTLARPLQMAFSLAALATSEIK